MRTSSQLTALVTTGRVRWQCVLNQETQPFLEVCDGLFLDYHWKDGDPQRSAKLAASMVRATAHQLA